MERPGVDVETVEQFLASTPTTDHASAWLLRMAGTKELTALVLGLIDTGEVQNEQEALAFCVEHVNGINCRDVRLTLGDFEGRRLWDTRLIDLCKRYDLMSKSSNAFRLHQKLGWASHRVMGALLQGDFPGYTEEPQSRLFELGVPRQKQEALFETTRGINWDAHSHAIVSNGVLSTGFVSELRGLHAEVREALRCNKQWDQAFEASRCYLMPLAVRLAPIVGIQEIEGVFNKDAWRTYLYLLSFVTWAHGVLLSQRAKHPKRRIYFLEVPVFGTHGGTADIVEVVSINGLPPNKRQREMLLHMQEDRRRYPELIEMFVQHFGPDILLRIVDLKFSVGDGGAKTPVLLSSRVSKGPLQGHARQLTRYMSLFQRRVAKAADLNGSAWDELRVGSGILDYYFPWGRRRHKKEPTPAELQEYFERSVRDMEPRATNRAHRRVATRELCRSVHRSIHGGVPLSSGTLELQKQLLT